jgi:two-component system sensor kinase FixL
MMDPLAYQPSRLAEALNRAILQIDRATEILRHLRNLSGQLDLDRSGQPIGRVIEDAITVSALNWAGVTIILRIAPQLPNGLINKVHIQQVLVNLMRNALEAMADRELRELIIAAEPSDPGMICISVCDSGPGLPREVLNNLFKPFVTTKETGMGVGLSICRRIIDAHGGRIWAENAETRGAKFQFTLPIDPTKPGTSSV